jgi:hypothetical protein
MYKILWTRKSFKQSVARKGYGTQGFATDHSAISHVERIGKAAEIQNTNTGNVVAAYTPNGGVVWYPRT